MRFDYASGVAVQRDGKIVVAGSSVRGRGATKLALARYRRDGSLDPSFGSGGEVLTNFNRRHKVGGSALVLEGGGRILVAGAADGDFALARFSKNGAVDRAFGSRGLALADFGATDEATSLALQPDGKAVVAGWRSEGSDGPSAFAVARFLPSGKLDSDFGSGGKVLTLFDPLPAFGPVGIATGIVVQGDGKILVAGQGSAADTAPRLALVRYLPDGSLDRSFGFAGKVLAGPGAFDTAEAVALATDGSIVTAGWNSPFIQTSWSFELARFRPDGSVDPGFGSGGTVIAPFTGTFTALSIRPDGRIVAAGTDGYGYSPGPFPTYRFAVARYLSDGAPDLSFGNGGRAVTGFGSSNDAVVAAMTVQADGKVVLAGWRGPKSGELAGERADVALARYQPDGSLDSSFGSGGTVRTSFSAVTRVASFSVTKSRKGARIGWRTSSEVRTRGFNVFAGRSDHRRRVNHHLILSKGTSLLGASYALLDRDWRPSTRYWLQELKLGGESVWRGPAVLRR